MDLFEGIRHRRSVRAYKPDPVPASVLETLIGAAVQAPSAMDEEPWRFTVVTNRKVMSAISDSAKTFMREAVAGTPRAEHLRAMLSNTEFHIFYHAPVLVVISAPEALPWCVEDCALAAQNLMLAAHARGLGSCWIGFAQGWLNTEQGRASIGLESDQRVVAPIILGFPQVTAPMVPRKSPHIHWVN